MRLIKWIGSFLAVLFCLGGCSHAPFDNEAERVAAQQEVSAPVFGVFADSPIHLDQAEEKNMVRLDLSSAQNGYVAVSAIAEKKLKFQIIKDEMTYTYNVASDGTPSVLPLQGGDGVYLFRMMENVTDNKYAQKYSSSFAVTLQDEFQPFIRPSDYVNYQENSLCVVKAKEMASDAEDELEMVAKVYEYICANVQYDVEKAQTVQSGYLPDPDETFTTGKGICFDYASLAAAMLRSQGIPTKVIFGYVSSDLYHAWNMFYTRQTGWVTVDYEVRKDSWNRLDLTFSANGESAEFILDGSNYAQVYCY